MPWQLHGRHRFRRPSTTVAWKQPAWKGAILLYILRGRSGARDAFFFRFGLSLRRIRDTVFLTTLINNSAAGQAPHDHYRQSNNENTTVLTHLPANSLFLTFQTCRNLLRETSLLFARDQVSDAWRFILALATLSNKPFSSRLPSSSTTVLSTNSKQHQHSKHRHRASISQISPIRDKAF